MKFRDDGFTLLEVMISVAIIGISFVTLIGSQSQSVSIAGQTRFAVNSAFLAQLKLAEIESTDFDQLFSEGGDFGDEYPSYRWQTQVEALNEDDTGIVGAEEMLKVVDLVVQFGDDEGPSYDVRTVVMKKVEPPN